MLNFVGFLQKNKFIAIGLAAFILILPVSLYFFSKYESMSADYKKTQELLQKSESTLGAQSIDNKAIIDEVSQLMELPKESPTIAPIPDITQLGNQPFFAHAQNGDLLIIYKDAKKALIYRQSANKIIEVDTVTFNNPSPSPSNPTTSPTPTFQSIPTAEPSPTPVQ